MKFVKLCNLSLSIAMTVTAVLGPALLVKNARDADIERAKNLSYKARPKLEVRVDTLNLSRENFAQKFPSAVAGLFFPTRNEVVVTYFNPMDNADYVNRTCAHMNGMLQLTMRHEMEHARKAHLTKILSPYYSAQTRARIAAMNETMAPASETIEALDYQYKTGTPIPSSKIFVAEACDSILKIIGKQIQNTPINFNDQKIADIVITNALNRFKSEIKKGHYVTTLQREYYNKNPISYTPHQECDLFLKLTFHPEYDMWAPMWQFETAGGQANLWLAASNKARAKTLNTIDSIINKHTGKTPPLVDYANLQLISTR